MKKTITSKEHPLVKHWVKLRTNKKYRYEQKAVFLEGKKSLEELSFPLETLILQENVQTALSAQTVVTVPPSLFQKISGVESPEGIAAEIAMPPMEDLSTKTSLLVLDQVRDPGNLGTLIRTAVAFGYEGVLLTENSVDPYNEKALRAAKGATFKIPLSHGPVPKGFHFYLADLEGTPIDTLEIQKPFALVLGSEAKGLSKEMRKNGTFVTIPLTGQMESLNVAVAGGILLHAMRQKHG